MCPIQSGFNIKRIKGCVMDFIHVVLSEDLYQHSVGKFKKGLRITSEQRKNVIQEVINSSRSYHIARLYNIGGNQACEVLLPFKI